MVFKFCFENIVALDKFYNSKSLFAQTEHGVLSTSTIATTVSEAGSIHFCEGQTLQAVEFPDGSTAIIQQKGDENIHNRY